MNIAKKSILISFLIILLLSLTSCGASSVDNTDLIFRPAVFIWNWFWKSFTPAFWKFAWHIWHVLPPTISWLAFPIVIVLGVILYIVIVVIFIVIYLIIVLLSAIIWFILSILNGIFKFY